MTAASAAVLGKGSSFTPPTTSYANAGGTGNRSGIITATNVGTAFGLGSPSNMVDGGTSNDCYFANGVGGTQFYFDFGVGAQKYIDEIRIKDNATNANLGTFQMAGSNDASSWTNIGSPFTWQGPTSGTTVSMVHAVPAAYRYYRFTSTSNTSNVDYILELEFKIG